MQTIATKYHGHTTTKGSKISADAFFNDGENYK